MNKQQATDYIIQQLQAGCAEDEITQALSQQLKVSPQIVGKFVAQVVQDQNRFPPPVKPPNPVDTHEVLLPPWLQSESFEPASSSPNLPASQNMRSNPVFAASAGVSAVVQPEPQVEKAQFANQVKLSPQEQAELEELILKALLKSRKQSDIILSICERTGLGWDQAQRMVAKVASHNRRKLVSGQNKLIIPLCILAILTGLALLAAAGIESYQVYAALSDGQTIGRNSDPREILWGLSLGFVMLIGGGFGLFRALQQQFDE